MSEQVTRTVDTISLAQSLARPVVRGLLPIEQAEAAIVLALSKRDKAGQNPGNGTLDDYIRLDFHFLHLEIKRLEEQRDAACQAIARVVNPLIGQHESKGRIRAEAHNVNAGFDIVLREAEVEQTIVNELVKARQRAQGPPQPSVRRARRYHGR